jgi:hypothetical protein
MLNPRCLVFRAKAQGKELSDSEIQDLSLVVPFAANCLECQRRKDGKLQTFCFKDI